MEFQFPPSLPRRGRQTPQAQPSLVTSSGREIIRLHSSFCCPAPAVASRSRWCSQSAGVQIERAQWLMQPAGLFEGPCLHCPQRQGPSKRPALRMVDTASELGHSYSVTAHISKFPVFLFSSHGGSSNKRLAPEEGRNQAHKRATHPESALWLSCLHLFTTTSIQTCFCFWQHSFIFTNFLKNVMS